MHTPWKQHNRLHTSDVAVEQNASKLCPSHPQNSRKCLGIQHQRKHPSHHAKFAEKIERAWVVVGKRKWKERVASTDTYTEQENEIHIVGKLLLACAKVKEPGQQKILHQSMQMVHVQKKLPCDVPLRSQPSNILRFTFFSRNSSSHFDRLLLGFWPVQTCVRCALHDNKFLKHLVAHYNNKFRVWGQPLLKTLITTSDNCAALAI